MSINIEDGWAHAMRSGNSKWLKLKPGEPITVYFLTDPPPEPLRCVFRNGRTVVLAAEDPLLPGEKEQHKWRITVLDCSDGCALKTMDLTAKAWKQLSAFIESLALPNIRALDQICVQATTAGAGYATDYQFRVVGAGSEPKKDSKSKPTFLRA